MRLARTAALVAATALVAAPIAASNATAAPAKHSTPSKPRFVISKLAIVGSVKAYDVSKAAAVVRIRVQVKDFDKRAKPAAVSLSVVMKGTDTAQAFVVKARLVGRSSVVSNWLGTITLPKGTAAATYCLRAVYANDTDPRTPAVSAKAKGLAGRDCFVVKAT